MARSMILAAGRGERMRPLSDARPKPLMEVGGRALIVWQIERLVEAGFGDIVINTAHHGDQIEAALGSGSAFGASLAYSREPHPLEVAGGIANALPLLGDGVALVVSADVFVDYDYSALRARVSAMEGADSSPHAHMVMVPNPAYHRDGDFVLRDGALALDGAPRLTFGNIALYRTALFAELPRGEKIRILPHYQHWIRQGWVSGEIFTGHWANVGTPDDLAELDAVLGT
ncbi:MAG: N-acetylmuramate alpha-1-phosphate uridylyltransferase MurU [Betaproteobacteria bacterium]